MPVSSGEQKVSLANAYLMKNDMFQYNANEIGSGRKRPVGGTDHSPLHHTYI